MSKDPMQNPSPSSRVPAYPEHGADGGPPATRVADGTAIKEVVAKSGKAQRPAPTIPQRRSPVTGQWKAKAS
jgi:hypothetical protein